MEEAENTKNIPSVVCRMHHGHMCSFTPRLEEITRGVEAIRKFVGKKGLARSHGALLRADQGFVLAISAQEERRLYFSGDITDKPHLTHMVLPLEALASGPAGSDQFHQLQFGDDRLPVVTTTHLVVHDLLRGRPGCTILTVERIAYEPACVRHGTEVRVVILGAQITSAEVSLEKRQKQHQSTKKRRLPFGLARQSRQRPKRRNIASSVRRISSTMLGAVVRASSVASGPSTPAASGPIGAASVCPGEHGSTDGSSDAAHSTTDSHTESSTGGSGSSSEAESSGEDSAVQEAEEIDAAVDAVDEDPLTLGVGVSAIAVSVTSRSKCAWCTQFIAKGSVRCHSSTHQSRIGCLVDFRLLLARSLQES